MAGGTSGGFNLAGLNELVRGLSGLRHGSTRFAFSSALAAVALAVSLLCELALGSEAAAIFAVFVAVSTVLFGVLAGFCTVAIAVLAVDYFYLPPVWDLTLDGGTLRVALGLSAVVAVARLSEKQLRHAIRRRRRPPIGLQGSFDAVEGNEAYGWALDADRPQDPVIVTAFINGRPVAQVAAVHYRPDVAQKRQAGSHGFYVDLSAHLPSQGEATVEVRYPNGWPLPGCPKVARLTARPCARRHTVLFMHIPKTAGTALREAIAANYRQSELAYLYPSPPGFLMADLRALPLEQLRGLRMVIGHFQFGMHDWLPTAAEYITIVREPVARVLSQYRFLCQTQGAGPVPPLEQLLERELSVNFDNAMVRCFAGVDEREYGPGCLNEGHYRRAVSNMRQAFVYVGHQEHLSNAYRSLAKRYDWQPDAPLAMTNVSETKEDGEVPASLQEVVREYNRWDSMLYEEVRRTFPVLS
jgi:hypothetical protein